MFGMPNARSDKDEKSLSDWMGGHYFACLLVLQAGGDMRGTWFGWKLLSHWFIFIVRRLSDTQGY